MAIETYQVLDTYMVFVNNDDNIDDSINLKVVVLSLEGHDRLFIRYSHTMIPHEDAAGPWYSNSMTHAENLEEAKSKIEMFARQMERAYKIVPWNEDL